MARVKCPVCNSEFDVCNHEAMNVAAFNDTTNNVIGTLVPAKEGETKMVEMNGVATDELVAELVKRGVDVSSMKVTDVLAQKDEIKGFIYQKVNGEWVMKEPKTQTAKDIFDKGYIKHNADWRRWIPVKTVELLDCRDGVYSDKSPWYENMNKCFNYIYTFDSTLEALNRLRAMEHDNNTEALAIESKFFSQETIYWIIKDYADTVKWFIEQYPVKLQQKSLKYYHVPALKWNRDFLKGNVYCKDVKSKVIDPIMEYANNARRAATYNSLYNVFYLFRHDNLCFPEAIQRIHWDVKKSIHWSDAFEGVGAYFTMDDLIRYDGLTLTEYETGRKLNMYESLLYMDKQFNKLSEENGIKWYKLMFNLWQSMKDVQFNFSKVIEKK